MVCEFIVFVGLLINPCEVVYARDFKNPEPNNQHARQMGIPSKGCNIVYSTGEKQLIPEMSCSEIFGTPTE